MPGKPLIKANTYVNRTKVKKQTIANLPEYCHWYYSQSQPTPFPMDLDFMITSSVLFKKHDLTTFVCIPKQYSLFGVVSEELYCMLPFMAYFFHSIIFI